MYTDVNVKSSNCLLQNYKADAKDRTGAVKNWHGSRPYYVFHTFIIIILFDFLQILNSCSLISIFLFNSF